MNEKVTTAAESRKESREIVAVCDVFDLAKTKAWYAQRGYQPTGNWQYANAAETIVRVEFARPATLSFSVHDLVDNLLDLFLRGRYSRHDALRCLTAIKKGGAQ